MNFSNERITERRESLFGVASHAFTDTILRLAKGRTGGKAFRQQRTPLNL